MIRSPPTQQDAKMTSNSSFSSLSDALKVCTYYNDKMAERAAQEATVIANPARQPVFYKGQIVGYSVTDPNEDEDNEKNDGCCGCSESPAQCIQCQCSDCGHCLDPNVESCHHEQFCTCKPTKRKPYQNPGVERAYQIAEQRAADALK